MTVLEGFVQPTPPPESRIPGRSSKQRMYRGWIWMTLFGLFSAPDKQHRSFRLFVRLLSPPLVPFFFFFFFFLSFLDLWLSSLSPSLPPSLPPHLQDFAASNQWLKRFKARFPNLETRYSHHLRTSQVLKVCTYYKKRLGGGGGGG